MSIFLIKKPQNGPISQLTVAVDGENIGGVIDMAGLWSFFFFFLLVFYKFPIVFCYKIYF
jgi:hypothetical protein